MRKYPVHPTAIQPRNAGALISDAKALKHSRVAPEPRSSDLSTPETWHQPSIDLVDAADRHQFEKFAIKLLESNCYFYVISIATSVSFVLDDLRVAALPSEADTAVDTCIMILLGVFCGDILLKWVGSEEYLGSGFFWMDLGATVGGLWDIQSVYERMGTQCGSERLGGVRVAIRSARLSGTILTLIRHLNLTKSLTIHKQALLSQGFADTPMSPFSPQPPRVVRSNSSIVSIPDDPATLQETARPSMRKIDRQNSDTTAKNRKAKKRGTLYRLWQQESIEKKLRVLGGEEQTEEVWRESGVSKLVTRRLVGIVGVVGVMLGGFEWVVERTGEARNADPLAVKLLAAINDVSANEDLLWLYISRFSDSQSLTVLTSLSFNGTFIWADSSAALRASDKCLISAGVLTAEFNVHKKQRTLAVFDICNAMLLCLLFCYVCLDASKFIRDTVLFPLERMLDTVSVIYRNPLSLMQSTRVRRQSHIEEKKCCRLQKHYADEEVFLLENALRKIGLMLGLVYGSAGSEMIACFIIAQGQVNPIVPGRKLMAIFCFAKIGDFDWALDTLGPGILSYINLISGFVHNTAERYLGSVNKNLGDSYLLVWKFVSEEDAISMNTVVLNPLFATVRSTTSLALMFAVKTVSKVATNPAVAQYRLQLQHRSRHTESLTFGFHVGWAFEGPIGSAFKIDASYLSPNVNMAARIQTAAVQYGVKIAVSRDVLFRLDDEVRTMLRHIDTVRLKGVFEPVPLYSFDIGLPDCERPSQPPTKRKTMKKRKRLKKALDEGLISVGRIFSQSATVAFLRRKYPKEFFDSYSTALELYLEGRWNDAYRILATQCVSLVPSDGPTRVLMSYLEGANYLPPKSWSGVRDLIYK